MKKVFFLLLLCSFFKTYAQDERFFRRILSGDLIESEKGVPEKKNYHYISQTPLYEIDMKSDGKPLALGYEVKDAEHWVTIYDSPSGKKILFKGKLETTGNSPSLFRVSMRDLSTKVKLLILFFYEGNSNYLEFNGTGRLYYITMENKDVKTLALNKGPFFFQEREEQIRGYYQRDYKVDLYDFNKDGIRDVIVKHGYISRISMYLGEGKWKEI